MATIEARSFLLMETVLEAMAMIQFALELVQEQSRHGTTNEQ